MAKQSPAEKKALQELDKELESKFAKSFKELKKKLPDLKKLEEDTQFSKSEAKLLDLLKKGAAESVEDSDD